MDDSDSTTAIDRTSLAELVRRLVNDVAVLTNAASDLHAGPLAAIAIDVRAAAEAIVMMASLNPVFVDPEEVELPSSDGALLVTFTRAGKPDEVRLVLSSERALIVAMSMLARQFGLYAGDSIQISHADGIFSVTVRDLPVANENHVERA